MTGRPTAGLYLHPGDDIPRKPYVIQVSRRPGFWGWWWQHAFAIQENGGGWRTFDRYLDYQPLSHERWAALTVDIPRPNKDTIGEANNG